MIKAEILCAGRLKEPYWLAAAAEYEKRLSPQFTITVRECPEDKPLPVFQNKAFTVALCVEGEQLSSEQWARRLYGWIDGGASRLRFLIGGSNGLFPEDKTRADFSFSLSKLTLPHHMARVFLLEQLYRAMTLRNGGAYHK